MNKTEHKFSRLRLGRDSDAEKSVSTLPLQSPYVTNRIYLLNDGRTDSPSECKVIYIKLKTGARVPQKGVVITSTVRLF